MQTELTCQRLPFWSKYGQSLPNHFISKEAISIASYVPNFLHMKMTTSSIFPINISPFVTTKHLALHLPLQAILMKAVLKRQTFWVILFMGKIMAFFVGLFWALSFVVLLFSRIAGTFLHRFSPKKITYRQELWIQILEMDNDQLRKLWVN